MTMDSEYPNGCKEEFAELCALSTSGVLSAVEMETLNQHLAGCASCAALLREYASLVHIGMAKLAAELNPAMDGPVPPGQRETRVERRFLEVLRTAQAIRQPRTSSDIRSAADARLRRRLTRPALSVGAAAMVLLSLGGAFELGRRTPPASSHATFPEILRPATATDSEKERLRMELRAAHASLTDARERTTGLTERLVRLSRLKESLVAQIDTLTASRASDQASLATAKEQLDSLEHQLSEASAALVRARADLERVQQDRQGAFYRVATLEAEVRGLHSEISSSRSSANNDERFLAEDRDIRELMGARQLYIADVFDVKNNGERSAPFGRVFYTKGRSLVFYAFDLEKQPGYRETKAFQAWGKPDGASAKPISIGIFYLDNEQNRRWVVKSDRPEILAQINSVFVTVEPRGGSQRPSGKPFLEAYLHTLPPNHP